MLRPFGVGEFRVVWLAELLSVAGDQLARVALAVLVFSRTGSASLSAVTYALTFLPALAGGFLLAWTADAFPRRTVMVASDVGRAALVGVMAIPGLPLPVMCAALVVVVLLGTPHTAAQSALMPEILGELYERGLAIRQITAQLAQLAGFATGGVVVAVLSPSTALVVDAATFVVSGLLARIGLARRPRPRRAVEHVPSALRRLSAGLRVIGSDARRRSLVLLAVLVGCYVVPEALAAPYVGQLGAGPAAVGLLMAADPLGGVLGTWLYVRFVPLPVRERTIGLVAAAAAVPLLFMPLHPPVGVTMVLFGLSGACATAYLLQTQASFVRVTPDGLRGQAIGVAASAIIAAQGLAVLLAGPLADRWNPAAAVAASGVVGVVASAAAAVAWARARRNAKVDEPAPA